MTTSTSSSSEPSDVAPESGASDDDGFVASRYYAAAWTVVRRDPLVIVWKLLGDFASSAFSLVLGGTALVLLFATVMAGLTDPTAASPLSGMLRFIGRPSFAFGSVGLLGTVWLSALFFDALFTGGIWNVLSRGARGDDITPFRSFVAGAVTQFPRVLGLRVMSGVVQATMVFLLGAFVISVVESTTGFGALSMAPTWLKSLLWASGLTLFFALSGLSRMAIEVASAPLMVGGMTLGESLLEGARLVATRFLEIYRILIFAAALWLAPLVLYWVVLMGQNLTMDQPTINALFTAGRFVAEFLLFVATGVISLHLYGSYFFYWAKRRGYIDALPTFARDDDPKAADATQTIVSRNEQPTDDVADDVDDVLVGTTLDELLPPETPYVFDVDELVAHSRHDKPESVDDHDEEDDDDPSTDDEPNTDDEQPNPQSQVPTPGEQSEPQETS